MTIGDRIIATAEEFEGLVEIISNAEWDDPKTKGPDARAAKFEKLLKSAGHADGAPYCASFVEGVWIAAYRENASTAILAQIQGLLTPHVMTSFNNCNRAGLISQVPQRGAIGFMQNGDRSTGHAFLVRGVQAGMISTIEANTSPTDANERDGGIGTGGVYRKRRHLSFIRRNGLWLRGFLNPIPV